MHYSNKKTQFKKINFSTLCDSCSHQNCCTNSQEPILFQHDLEKLRQIEKDDDDFLQKLMIDDLPVKSIKKKNNSKECIFWDASSSQCSIYQNRPFDCKAYPFDILKKQGKFFWIVYSCNDDSDWEWSEEYLNMLENDESFPDIIKNIDIFAGNTKRILPEESQKTPYVVLREVQQINLK